MKTIDMSPGFTALQRECFKVLPRGLKIRDVAVIGASIATPPSSAEFATFVSEWVPHFCLAWYKWTRDGQTYGTDMPLEKADIQLNRDAVMRRISETIESEDAYLTNESVFKLATKHCLAAICSN